MDSYVNLQHDDNMYQDNNKEGEAENRLPQDVRSYVGVAVGYLQTIDLCEGYLQYSTALLW